MGSPFDNTQQITTQLGNPNPQGQLSPAQTEGYNL